MIGASQTFCYSDKVLINYETRGHGPTPLIFIHGFAAALVTWHDIAPLFPVELYTLYFLDLKGFGLSSKPRDARYSLDDQTDIIISFLNARNIVNAALVGHSLGGTIALLAWFKGRALGRPELISRLILISCAAYPQRLPRLMRLVRTPFVGSMLMYLVPPRTIVKYTLPRVFYNHAAITEERIERYVHCYKKRGIGYSFAMSVRQLMPGGKPLPLPDYGKVSVPVLIIWGGNDRIIRRERGERLASALPAAQLVIVEECGHNPHEEKPEQTCAIIREFLETGKSA
ncbi:MAG: alpha/beta hydrolase [Geobacter sp.]|nr:alpha/beta hydrolase [Geobacter sp.]